MYSLKSALLCLVILTATTCEELPDFIHVCKKSDPDINACIFDSVNTLKPYLVSGLPQYDIPSLEPIILGDLIVAGSKTGQGLFVTGNDIKAYGASNWILKNLNIVEYASKYSFQIELPLLYVEGGYNVDGKILFIPVKGAGTFSGNFTGGEGTVRIKGIQKEINGENHFVVNKMDIKIKLQKGQIKLEDFFGGDKVLGEIVGQTINQNFEIFSQDLIPLIEKSLARIFKRSANKILERFTMAQLFPL